MGQRTVAGPGLLRKWERKYALTTEYSSRQATAG